ncbi:tetratricopeptide repeat protein [Aliarcobacter vitoriensis]|uniref:tetratricopeptide repeat protein n=1 Tax=Aliarcobacter vitoriensis TaxID=2011099 RepID=UPI003AAC2D38
MKFLAIFFILFTLLNAKDKEFYYSFIDSNGKQISSKTKESIINTLNELENIKEIALDGKINEAFKRLVDLKDNNKISLLNSDILILYSELVLKNQSKKLLLDTSNELENAINSSVINQEDLLKAYLLLIDLKLSVNRVEDARYYAQTVIDVFDDEEAKAKGKIALGKIFKYQKDYPKASKTLFDILRNTKDKNIASIIGNELFDVYLLEGKKDEAKELMKQLLVTNPSFFSNDFILANQRVDLLLKLDMTLLAVDILKDLIKTSKKQDILEKAEFKLANIYMKLYDKTDLYLNLAKKLYKNIVDSYPKSEYFEASQIYFDEIKMRQRLISPNTIADKYNQNEAMQNKALLQELINNNIDKKFEQTVKIDKVYRDIPKDILQRFGFNNIDELLDISYIGLIKEYLENDDCSKLSTILKDVKYEIFKDLLDDNTIKNGLIKCISEVPSLENYTQLKNIFKDVQNLDIYFMLETMALSVDEIEDALYFSSKIEKANDKDILEKEFLYKYQVLKIKNDSIKFDKFFANTLQNKNLIDSNTQEPVIVDFYYDFYLYLLKENNQLEATKILKDLYDKQKDFKINVYSPFVESELSKIAKNEQKFEEAVNYLVEASQNVRNLKVEDEVKIYYDIVMLYDTLDNKEKKDEYLQKCKDVKIEDNLYKKMCLSLGQ